MKKKMKYLLGRSIFGAMTIKILRVVAKEGAKGMIMGIKKRFNGIDKHHERFN